MDTLTLKQKRVFDCIRKFFEREERPPTIRELSEQLSCHIKTVYQYLELLDKKGFTERRNGRVFITKKYSRNGIPVLGRVSAGFPLFAEEHFEGVFSFKDFFNENELFMLRVKGNSMINAHICDNDFVIVHHKEIVENGDISDVPAKSIAGKSQKNMILYLKNM